MTPRYSERVLALFRELPGAGRIGAGPGKVVAGEAGSPERGAWVRFEARVAGGRITDCRFTAWGCPHTLAASALARESLLAGRQGGGEAVRLAAELDVPPEKMGRLLVVEDAVKALLADAARVQ